MEAVGAYRYGFNGKEKDVDGEWGDLTHYDYGFRIYNPGIAKFLSVDPLAPEYPSFLPYLYAGNNPIALIDRDGQGPDLPPKHIIKAIISYNRNFFDAILAANNTSNLIMYNWATDKQDLGRREINKLKGAIGEAIVLERFRADVGWYGTLMGAEDLFNVGESFRSPNVANLQVDVTSWGFLPYIDIGLNHRLGIRNFGLYGNENDMTIMSVSEYNGWYRENIEVKALSAKTNVGDLFDYLVEAINQTIARGEGEENIGVLVVDIDAWLKVASSSKYGKKLRAHYKRLTSGSSATDRNYLRLEDGLSDEANRGLHGLKDAVNSAENEPN